MPATATPAPPWLDIHRAAKALGVTVSVIRSETTKGRLGGVLVGQQYRYPRRVLAEYIVAHTRDDLITREEALDLIAEALAS